MREDMVRALFAVDYLKQVGHHGVGLPGVVRTEGGSVQNVPNYLAHGDSPAVFIGITWMRRGVAVDDAIIAKALDLLHSTLLDPATGVGSAGLSTLDKANSAARGILFGTQLDRVDPHQAVQDHVPGAPDLVRRSAGAFLEAILLAATRTVLLNSEMSCKGFLRTSTNALCCATEIAAHGVLIETQAKDAIQDAIRALGRKLAIQDEDVIFAWAYRAASFLDPKQPLATSCRLLFSGALAKLAKSETSVQILILRCFIASVSQTEPTLAARMARARSQSHVLVDDQWNDGESASGALLNSELDSTSISPTLTECAPIFSGVVLQACTRHTNSENSQAEQENAEQNSIFGSLFHENVANSLKAREESSASKENILDLISLGLKSLAELLQSTTTPDCSAVAESLLPLIEMGSASLPKSFVALFRSLLERICLHEDLLRCLTQLLLTSTSFPWRLSREGAALLQRSHTILPSLGTSIIQAACSAPFNIHSTKASVLLLSWSLSLANRKASNPLTSHLLASSKALWGNLFGDRLVNDIFIGLLALSATDQLFGTGGKVEFPFSEMLRLSTDEFLVNVLAKLPDTKSEAIAENVGRFAARLLNEIVDRLIPTPSHLPVGPISLEVLWRLVQLSEPDDDNTELFTGMALKIKSEPLEKIVLELKNAEDLKPTKARLLEAQIRISMQSTAMLVVGTVHHLLVDSYPNFQLCDTNQDIFQDYEGIFVLQFVVGHGGLNLPQVQRWCRSLMTTEATGILTEAGREMAIEIAAIAEGRDECIFNKCLDLLGPSHNLNQLIAHSKLKLLSQRCSPDDLMNWIKIHRPSDPRELSVEDFGSLLQRVAERHSEFVGEWLQSLAKLTLIDEGWKVLLKSSWALQQDLDKQLESFSGYRCSDFLTSVVTNLGVYDQNRDEKWCERACRWVCDMIADLGSSSEVERYFEFIKLACGLVGFTGRRQLAVNVMNSLADGFSSLCNPSGPRTNGGHRFLKANILYRSLVVLSRLQTEPPVYGSLWSVDIGKTGDFNSDRPVESDDTEGEEADDMDEEFDEEDSRESKSCTFVTTGNQFVEQHWYFCYSCNLTASEGICGVCARVCHRGHQVAYSRLSRFFCDCGAAAVASVSALEAGDTSGNAHSCKALNPQSLSQQNQDGLSQLQRKILDINAKQLTGYESRIDKLWQAAGALTPFVHARRVFNGMVVPQSALFSGVRGLALHSMGKNSVPFIPELSDAPSMVIPGRTGELRTLWKVGSLLAQKCTDQTANRRLVCFDRSSRVAVVDTTKVILVDISAATDCVMPTEPLANSSMQILARMEFSSPISFVSFHPTNKHILLTASADRFELVDTRSPAASSMSVNFRIEENQLEARENEVIDVNWVAGSKMLVAVGLAHSLRIYEPLADPMIPSHILQMHEGENIVAIATGAPSSSPFVALATNQKKLHLVVLDDVPAGYLDMSTLAEIKIPTMDGDVAGLSFVPWLRSLVVASSTGKHIFGKFNADRATISWTNSCISTPSKRILSSWDAPGYLVSLNTSNTALTSVRVEATTIYSQESRLQTVEGGTGAIGMVLCDVGPLVPFVLTVNGDGSLCRLDFTSEEGTLLAPKARVLGGHIESAGSVREPSQDEDELNAVGLFEKARLVSSDQLRFGDDEPTNRTLRDGQCWVSQSPDEAQQISVECSNRNIVLVGARALFGNCDRSRARMPSEIRVFNRRVPADTVAGSKRWVDMAFMHKESVASPSSFVLELIPLRDGLGDGFVAMDSLEVYSMTSVEFIKQTASSRRSSKKGRPAGSSERSATWSGESEALIGLETLNATERATPEIAALFLDTSELIWPKVHAWCRDIGKDNLAEWEKLLHEVATKAAVRDLADMRGFRITDLEHAVATTGAMLGCASNDRKVSQVLLAAFLDVGPDGWTHFLDANQVCVNLVNALWKTGLRKEVLQLLTLEHFICASSCASALGNILKAGSHATTAESERQSSLRFPRCDKSYDEILECAKRTERLCGGCSDTEGIQGPSHVFVSQKCEGEVIDVDFDWVTSEIQEVWEAAENGYSLVHICAMICDVATTEEHFTCLERKGFFRRLESSDFGSASDVNEIEKDVVTTRLIVQLFEGGQCGALCPTLVLSLVSIINKCVEAIESLPDVVAVAPTGLLDNSLPEMRNIIPQGFEIVQQVSKLEFSFLFIESAIRVLDKVLSPVEAGRHLVPFNSLVDDLFALLFIQSKMSLISSCPRLGYLYSSFRYAKKLLLAALDGNKVDYNAKLDDVFLTKQMAKVSSLAEPSLDLCYDKQAQVSEALCAMVLIMEKRPWNWIQFCNQKLKDEVDLELLCRIGRCFPGCIQISSFRLLAVSYAGNVEFAIAAISATGENTESRLRKEQYAATSPSTASANFLLKQNMRVLKILIDRYLLMSGHRSVRLSIYFLVRGIMTMVKERGQPGLLEELQDVFIKATGRMSSLGRLSEQFTQLISDSMREMNDVKYCNDIAGLLLASFREASEFLTAHPNSHVYRALRKRILVEGYFLESEPCVSCASSLGLDQSPFEHRLDSLRVETKYTDCAIMHRFVAPQAISRVSVKVSESRRSRRPRQINLWYSGRTVSEASELKSAEHPWKQLKPISLAVDHLQGEVDFPLPVVAGNLMIEFAEFHGAEDQRPRQQSGGDRLQCPRCSRPVSDRHGICRNCRENAYQCRQCRNINYDNLDAFLCNECGYCKHGRFEFSALATASFSAERIDTESDRKRAIELIEKGTILVHRRYEEIKNMRQSILNILSSLDLQSNDSGNSQAEPQMGREVLSEAAAFVFGALGDQRRLAETNPGQESDTIDDESVAQSPTARATTDTLSQTEIATLVTRQVSALATTYGRECKALFIALSYGLQTLRELRKELARHVSAAGGTSEGDFDRDPHQNTKVRCYGCAQSFVGHALKLLELLVRTKPEAKKNLLDQGLCLDLLRSYSVHEHRSDAPALTKSLICELVSGDAVATQQVCDEIAEKLTFCVNNWEELDVAGVSRAHIMILDGMMKIEDDCWEIRLKMVLKVLFFAAPMSSSSSIIAESIVLPCVTAAVQLARGEQDDTSFAEERIISIGLEDDAFPRVDYDEWLNGKQTFEEWSAEMGHCRKEKLVRTRQVASQKVNTSQYKTVDTMDEWSWLIQLLILSPNSAVRRQVSTLLEILCHDDGRNKDEKMQGLLDILTEAPLSLAASRGEHAREYFDLLSRVVEPIRFRSYLASTGFLHRAASLIEDESRELEEAEVAGPGFLDLSRGFCLSRLAELLRDTLRALQDQKSKEWLGDAKALVGHILRSFLAVQRLVTQQTRQTDEAKAILLSTLSSSDCLGERPEVLESYLEELVRAEESRDRPRIVILLEQLCGALSPEKLEPSYELVLNKAPTQEEFIRGNMSRNSYSSASIGPLMRDVKNKICRDLELTGLLEDDFGMELLVASNLIKLDLTVRSVFENIWRSHQGPMIIVYRLSGLDGEATEPIIDDLPESTTEEIDPEEEFKATAALGQAGGLNVLISLLQEVSSYGDADSHVWSPTLRLLRACCSIKSNRRILAATGTPVAVLLDCAAKAFLCDLPGAGRAAESILLVSEIVLAEVPVPVDNPSDNIDNEEVLTRLRVFLERIETSSSKAETTLIRVLPFLTQGAIQAVELVMSYFTKRIFISKLDTCPLSRRTLSQLTAVLEAAPRGTRGDHFRVSIFESGLSEKAIHALSAYFPYPRKQFTDVWSGSLEAAGPPLILRLLRVWVEPLIGSTLFEELGVVSLFREIIRTLVSMETVASSGAIGSLAEELVEVVRQNSGLASLVDGDRKRIKEARRQAAATSRATVLRESGVLDFSGSLTSEHGGDMGSRHLSRAASLGMEEILDEVGASCVVCGDGFRSRPDEVLGVYVYSKRYSLPKEFVRLLGVSASGGTVYSSLTYFNGIHQGCHTEAYRMDRAMRIPRTEWDGATLRNSQTLCNNIMPLRPPLALDAACKINVSASAIAAAKKYTSAVELYFSRLGNLSRGTLAREKLLLVDLALSLNRFSLGNSICFSANTRGGGAFSNGCLLPHLIQLTVFAGLSGYSERLDDYLKNDDRRSNGEVFLALALSLALDSYKTWCERFPVYLERAMQESSHAKVDDSQNGDVEMTRRQALVLMSFVHQLQRFLKRGLSEEPVKCMSAVQVRICHEHSWLTEGTQAMIDKYDAETTKVSSNDSFLLLICTELDDDIDEDQFIESLLPALELSK